MNSIDNLDAKVFYVVGASGSGKDSLIRNFREIAVKTEAPIVTAHRYITRKTNSDEGSVYLSEPEFLLREQNDFFSMSWRANGLHYGIGAEIHDWLNKGYSVVVNGSRAYLAMAKRDYGSALHSILVDVPERTLRERLQKRSRESDEAIEARLERHRELSNTISCDSEVCNSYSIEDGTMQFKDIVFSALENAIPPKSKP